MKSRFFTIMRRWIKTMEQFGSRFQYIDGTGQGTCYSRLTPESQVNEEENQSENRFFLAPV